MSKGSLTELENQIVIAKDLEYINQTQFNDVMDQMTVVGKLLTGLIKSIKSF
jgi:four helix bundle protein